MEVLVVEVGEPGLPRAPRGRGRSGGGSADTSAKPGSQYWIVGHGGWQLHLRKSGGNPPNRPKISRRLRRILTPRSSTPSFRTKIHQVIEFFNTPAEAEAMLETVLEDEPEWRETLYMECVEFVTGGRTSAPVVARLLGRKPRAG